MAGVYPGTSGSGSAGGPDGGSNILFQGTWTCGFNNMPQGQGGTIDGPIRRLDVFQTFGNSGSGWDEIVIYR
jgi:hypothetical protein